MWPERLMGVSVSKEGGCVRLMGLLMAPNKALSSKWDSRAELCGYLSLEGKPVWVSEGCAG